MSLEFDHTSVFSTQENAKGLTTKMVSDYTSRLETAVATLRKAHAENTIAFLHSADGDAEINELEQVLPAFLQSAHDVVILGTGGSSLGGQCLVQLKHWHTAAEPFVNLPYKLHFLDNLDPISMSAILAEIEFKTSRFIAISKSGGTSETLLQVSSILAAIEAAGLKLEVSKFFLGLSEPELYGQKNALRRLLAPYNVKFLEHSIPLGGRFSVMSNVGMLPAVVMGLNAREIRSGANSVLQQFLNAGNVLEIPAAFGALAATALSEQQSLNTTVIMGYSDRFDKFTSWFVQLWSESLGKQGKGLTPVRALGPVDQHSSVQLFVDGPKDKFFTILTTGCKSKGPKIPVEFANVFDSVFANKTIGDLVAAQGKATADTLARNGQPTRNIHIEDLNEFSLGALLMHFMLETALTANLFNINAYDQPAVEEGKIRAKEILMG